MRLNENVVVYGRKVVLLPYLSEHVPLYHRWMSCPELLHMTESEKLSLEEEYESMRLWRNDPDKLTFLVYDIELQCLVGDVNLIMNVDAERPGVAEVDVMTAEFFARRRGLATEATILIMRYSMKYLATNAFVAKILESNSGSVAMFEKLGFQLAKKVAVFNELHFLLDVTKLDELCSHEGHVDFREGTYSEFLTRHHMPLMR